MARRSSPGKAKQHQARPVFDSIRKPGAPPGHPIARAKPDEVARPAGRKANTSDGLNRQKRMFDSTVQNVTKTDDHAMGRAFIAHASEYLLHDYLPKIERCLEKLSDEQIWWRPNAESNSIGNLVLHLSGNVQQWIVCGIGVAPDTRNRDAEFEQRDVIPRDKLLALLRSTLSDVQTTLQSIDPSTLLERRNIQSHDREILEAIFHVVEHFSMHAGQIFLLTKLLTGTDLRFYDFEAD